MKKLWLMAPLAALAFTACEVSTSSDESNPPPPPPQENVPGEIHAKRGLTTDYVTVDVAEFTEDDGYINLYFGSCGEKGGALAWSAENVSKLAFDYFPARDSVAMTDLEDNSKTGLFYGIDGSFPYGMYYEAATAYDKVSDGMIFGKDKTTKFVSFVDTECPFTDLPIGSYFASEIAEVPASEIEVGCNSTVFRGLSIELGKIKKEGYDFTIGFAGKKCDVDMKTRFALYEQDCKAAYDEFKQDLESGEMAPDSKFDFEEDYKYAAAADECLVEVLMQWMIALDDPDSEVNVNLKKKASKPANMKKFLAKIANGIRGK